MNGTAPKTTTIILRRIVIIIGIIIGVLLYARGWTVVDINLERPREERRQENVTNALRELLSPNIFERETARKVASANFIITDDPDTEVPVIEIERGEPYIKISPQTGERGDIITVEGFDFAPEVTLRFQFAPPDGNTRPRDPINTDRIVITDGAGTFSVQIDVPSIRGAEGGISRVQVQASSPTGFPHFTEISWEVFARMSETIFLALIATSLAIPISVMLSFLAANNIMRPVRMQVGSLLAGFIFLPIGWWLGTQFLSPVGNFFYGLTTGNIEGQSSLLIISLTSTLAIGATVSAQKLNILPNNNNMFSKVLRSVALILVVIIVCGLLSGLAVFVGNKIMLLGRDNLPATTPTFGSWIARQPATLTESFGNFVNSLGQLLQLLLVGISGIGGAVIIGGMGTDIVNGSTLRKIDTRTDHILGGVLGALGGMVLMMLVAAPATWAALFGLLPVLVAAILGGQLLVTFYRRFTKPLRDMKVTERASFETIRLILRILGAAIFGWITFTWLKVDRALIEGFLPQQTYALALGGLVFRWNPTINLFGIEIALFQTYVVKTALIGILLGAGLGTSVGAKANFPIGTVVYNITRSILNTLRSIEPLIMGLVFVVWVGIGPFAGTLALTLHSVAALGKLYSEQTENIDDGPIEAIQSTGANRLQTIVYAVVPQIVPPYIAFTMYRWDINVRMSTIIGFVGGGGIGFLLSQQINLLRYRDAGVAVIAIALVVSLLDYTSAYIRERLI